MNLSLSTASQDSPPIEVGSEAHKRLFCAVMLDIHDPFDPEGIVWPKLDEAERDKLKSLPFWNEAVTIEDSATRDLEALAEAETDPLVRRAVALQAFEEQRHGRVIAAMCRAYGIAASIEPGYVPPRDPEWEVMRLGYGECFDSFFAFGLFALAKDSGFFNPELVKAFEPVIQEEARHIVFFVNWAAWNRARRPLAGRLAHRTRCLKAFGLQSWRRLKTARSAGKGDFSHKSAGDFSADFSPRRFFELCLSEHERRIAGYDSRLLRPRAMPSAVRLATKLMARGKAA